MNYLHLFLSYAEVFNMFIKLHFNIVANLKEGRDLYFIFFKRMKNVAKYNIGEIYINKSPCIMIKMHKLRCVYETCKL